MSNTYSLQILENRLLTPEADKSIYSLVLVNTDGEIDYQPGDWALIQGQNPSDLAGDIIEKLNLSSEQVVSLPRLGDLSVQEALAQKLEITQLNPAILNKIQRKYQIGAWRDRQEMIDYAQEKDILDLLDAFPQLQTSGLDFLSLLSPLAPRYYSIASASTEELRLLYRQVEYQKSDRLRQGAVSTWLSRQKPGETIGVEIRHNPQFKLPDHPKTPIIMIASGTGLAPFIGFIEQRVSDLAFDNWLFFGETHPDKACLNCEQLAQWQTKQQLKLTQAFSRIEPKAYVQDKLEEYKEDLWEKWQQGAVVYLCGSQQKMAPEVQAFWVKLFAEKRQLDQESARKFWQESCQSKRIQQDIY